MRLPGYEFTDKKVRQKFKETEYGKQCNQYLYVSLTIFISTALLIFVGMLVLYINCKNEQQYNDFIYNYGNLYRGLIVIIGIVTCYFDGKRDGAIKQFELEQKTKK